MVVRHMPGHLIRRLHQFSMKVFAERMKEAGFDLTSVQFAALDAISDNPGIDQAGVAARIAYDRATIGGVIDRLQQKGLVARVVSKKDRRAREISLTEKGQATLAAIYPVVADLQPEILTRLSDDERKVFQDLLAKAALPAADSDSGQ